MRVIAGKYKSRILAEFKGEDVRPTSDRVKESLFGILSVKLYKAKVLDLFCGSGNLGIESLSRGAEEVVFNDASKDSLEILRKNLKTLKIEGQKVYNSDYMTCLNNLSAKFDIIFLDPPYAQEYGVSALKKIAQKDLLKDGGIAVYERDRKFEGEIEGLILYDERSYGRTVLSFFKKSE